jgi:hypothetical protein
MLQNAAMAKIELVARVFAETGVKRLMWLIHALSLKHARKAEIVRLRNKFVTIDPRQWKTRMDMTVSVGLGTGNRDQQIVHLQTILMMQERLIPLGLVSKANVRHAASKYIQAAGFKDNESFLAATPQNEQEEDQPIQMPAPPDPMMVEKVRQEGENQRTMVKEGEETKRTDMEIQSKERIEHAKIISGERQAQFQAQHAEKVKGAELQHDEMKTDKTLHAKAQETQAKAAPQGPDPLEQFTKAASEVIERAKASQGQESMAMLMQGLQAIVQSANTPKEIVRGPDGRAQGIRPAQ